MTSSLTAGLPAWNQYHSGMAPLIFVNLLKLNVLKFELFTAYKICQRILASRTTADCEHALDQNLLALCWETSIIAAYFQLYRSINSTCHLLFALDCCCGNVKNAYRSISRSMQPIGSSKPKTIQLMPVYRQQLKTEKHRFGR